MSPFPARPASAVAAAWGHRLPLDSAIDPRPDEFVRIFRLGPQTPEPGEPRTGGAADVA